MNEPAHKTSRTSPRVGWTSVCCLLVCVVAFWPGPAGICPVDGWPGYGCAAGVCPAAAAEPAAPAQPAAAEATRKAPADETQQPIDFDRARQLIQRRQRGETLSAEEEAYVRRAIEARSESQ